MIAKRRVVYGFGLFVLGTIACGVSRAAAADSFVQSVRALLLLQDAMAAGQTNSVARQRKIIEEIEVRFGGTGHGPEPNEANGKAALSYVLSGGPPEIAETLAKDERIPELIKRLLEAAVRFKRGDNAEALRLVSRVEAIYLPVDIAGRVALIQAMLMPETDLAKKQALLKLAVQLMPGTLVEEAALRRAVGHAADSGDMPEFWHLAERYVRRFSSSLFAEEFIADFIEHVVKLEKQKNSADRGKLEVLMNRFPVNRRRDSYLLLAQLASIAGMPQFTQYSAKRAQRLAVEGSREWQRAELYGGVYGVTGEDYGGQLARLHKLNPELLDATEGELLSAAIQVAERIRAPGKVDPLLLPEGGPSDLPTEQQALMTRAEQSLEAADAMLASLTKDGS